MKFELAVMPKYDSEMHDVIEALIFNEDREDYSSDEYQKAYEDIIVEEYEPETFDNIYFIHTTDKRYLCEYVKITKRADHYICMIFETISDECVVILNEKLETENVIY